jgi:hypothetical protein
MLWLAQGIVLSVLQTLLALQRLPDPDTTHAYATLGFASWCLDRLVAASLETPETFSALSPESRNARVNDIMEAVSWVARLLAPLAHDQSRRMEALTAAQARVSAARACLEACVAAADAADARLYTVPRLSSEDVVALAARPSPPCALPMLSSHGDAGLLEDPALIRKRAFDNLGPVSCIPCDADVPSLLKALRSALLRDPSAAWALRVATADVERWVFRAAARLETIADDASLLPLDDVMALVAVCDSYQEAATAVLKVPSIGMPNVRRSHRVLFVWAVFALLHQSTKHQPGYVTCRTHVRALAGVVKCLIEGAPLPCPALAWQHASLCNVGCQLF